jgi:Amt family ammonium transporter
VGGLAGAVLTGFFAEKAINGAGNNGLLFGNPEQVIIQILAVAATAIYAFVATYVLLKVISLFSPLRVESHEEEAGLDTSTHGESAYRI